jgi:hypothetical protein
MQKQSERGLASLVKMSEKPQVGIETGRNVVISGTLCLERTKIEVDIA